MGWWASEQNVGRSGWVEWMPLRLLWLLIIMNSHAHIYAVRILLILIKTRTWGWRPGQSPVLRRWFELWRSGGCWTASRNQTYTCITPSTRWSWEEQIISFYWKGNREKWLELRMETNIIEIQSRKICDKKHRKNCECCPGHSLTVSQPSKSLSL